MSLLLDAAKVWHSLNDVKYIITVGRKNTSNVIELTFHDSDFPHIAGMQYAKDVDFGLNPAEYYGESLVATLLDGTFNGKLIENSRHWEHLIKSRLNTIISIQRIIENGFYIAEFDRFKVNPISKIEAKYVIKSEETDTVFFVFFDEELNRFYCKSAFQNSSIDYTLNQTKMTVLEIIKSEHSIDTLIFRNPNYKIAVTQD